MKWQGWDTARLTPEACPHTVALPAPWPPSLGWSSRLSLPRALAWPAVPSSPLLLPLPPAGFPSEPPICNHTKPCLFAFSAAPPGSYVSLLPAGLASSPESLPRLLKGRRGQSSSLESTFLVLGVPRQSGLMALQPLSEFGGASWAKQGRCLQPEAGTGEGSQSSPANLPSFVSNACFVSREGCP